MDATFIFLNIISMTSRNQIASRNQNFSGIKYLQTEDHERTRGAARVISYSGNIEKRSKV